jgi:DNA polymerase (family 10)
MDNYAIADQLSLLARLMDIHGENSFKAKSYASAAFTIEKLPDQLSELAEEKIFSLRGIGESVGKKVMELIDTGELQSLKDLISKTPEGVLEMLNIKGLGPKKIHTLWKELKIDSIKKLRKACQENHIAIQKGFGEKTQQKILEAIQFQEQNTGRYLYAQIESFADAFQKKMIEEFDDDEIAVTGSFARQLEIIEKLEWVTTTSKSLLKKILAGAGFQVVAEYTLSIVVNAEETLQMEFHFADKKKFYSTLFKTSCSEEFFSAWQTVDGWDEEVTYKNEKEIFKQAGIQFIPACLREKKNIIIKARNKTIPKLIQESDIKGLIHAHSNWSDGAHTIEEMAGALIRLGFEYLVISDHSKAAYYAGGMTEQQIIDQHKEIDKLNKQLAPFKIFKSIECDILSNGALDYSDQVLSSFDLVIASIHSNLQMNEEKAMMRLLSAVENPYITILGHMTGRRLLKRGPYPVDHKVVIDACIEHGVVIEINANPQRLDMKWEWVDYAMEQGLILSINPDAHTIDEFYNIKYGVLAAQKGGLTKENNLSSFSKQEFELFLQKRKKLKSIS